jgi:hypothetical protein
MWSTYHQAGYDRLVQSQDHSEDALDIEVYALDTCHSSFRQTPQSPLKSSHKAQWSFTGEACEWVGGKEHVQDLSIDTSKCCTIYICQ